MIQDQIVQSRVKHVLRDWSEGAICLSQNIPEGSQQYKLGLENTVKALGQEKHQRGKVWSPQMPVMRDWP